MLSMVLEYMEEDRSCPHCNTELTLCHAPPVHVGDGLGWGSEYLFICLNDECSLFANGWQHIENQYGHVGSYRHMEIPDSEEKYNMMVAGAGAFTGSIVDIDEIKNKNERYVKEKEAVAALDSCVEQDNIEPVLYLLLDEAANINDRKRAAILLKSFNDLGCIEPLRSHTYRNTGLEQEINMTLIVLLRKNFKKECPFCAELIKERATVCKHCRKEFD
jgi:hypothetical protein